MKLINLIFIIIIVLANIAAYSVDAIRFNELDQWTNPDDHMHEDRLRSFFVLRKQTRQRLTCNKLPRVCRAKGSPGPKCCKKKCVDLLTDRRNCGKCGKKCKYNNICCNGKCVNPSSHKRHCGGCNNSCGSGGLCAFGLCSYA